MGCAGKITIVKKSLMGIRPEICFEFTEDLGIGSLFLTLFNCSASIPLWSGSLGYLTLIVGEISEVYCDIEYWNSPKKIQKKRGIGE